MECRTVNVVGLGGSMAEVSRSAAALRIVLEGAQEAGASTAALEIANLNLPMYTPEDGEPPESARRLADAVYEADGLVWSSPMYHGTVSGSFKNALDWLQLLSDRDPPYLANKVVGLVSTAGGVQGLQAVNTMEFVVRALRGWAVPLVIPVPRAWQAFDDQGRALDPGVDQQLRELGAEVTKASRQFRSHGFCDYSTP